MTHTLCTYKINYYRPSGAYETCDLWLWEYGKDGTAITFTDDAWVDLDGASHGFKQCTYETTAQSIQFIPRLNKWEARDGGDRQVTMPANQNTVEVWLVEGHSTVYHHQSAIDFSERVTNAFAETPQTLLVSTSIPVTDINSFTVTDTSGVTLKTIGELLGTTHYKLTLVSGEVKPNRAYTVEAPDLLKTNVRMRNILNTAIYDGELGAIYTPDSTTFRLWAPTATRVNVLVYETADTDVCTSLDMTPIATTGAWETIAYADLEGKYYLYEVFFANHTLQKVVDPYARSTSANSTRAAIIDLASTHPSRWAKDKSPHQATQADAILYELHIRDMSIDPTVPFAYPGMFKAMTEKGLKTPHGHAAGIDHLASLGITDVHLLPCFDFGSINESMAHVPTYTGRKYNWGYDPQCYNVPEGSYCTDATNPKLRITEFKEMVQALHESGIRVIMDVVYNHTYNIVNNPFGMIAPEYYYRTSNETGSYGDEAGLGNEVATERPMVRKFILDSVRYWQEEYHIDGFRFDLMGLIDTPTMISITSALQDKDPSCVIYGEPWTALESFLDEKDQTLKGTQKGQGFKAFNDHIREAIKGGSDDHTKGFATGLAFKESDIVEGIKGSITTIAKHPVEMINYVTAHDNLNMWDKVIKTQGLEKAEGFLALKDGVLIDGGSVAEAVEHATLHHAVDTHAPLHNETVKRSILANAIVLTSQGVPFIHAGDECLRSKFGDHNSYSSPDCINQIRWQDKDNFIDVFNYYKGLIALRKAHPAFRMLTADSVVQHLEILSQEDNIVSFVLKDHANHDSWQHIVVIYNANTVQKEVELPHEGDWHIVVDGQQAGIEPFKTLSHTKILQADPLAMTVLFS